jgi:ribosomal protein S18 acetylase RimI-like enzyme
MQGGMSLRLAVDSDRDFLRSLFASTREQELAFLPPDAITREFFISSQFDAQREAYRHAFPGADHRIIEIETVAAGRFYVDRSPGTLHVIDISLLPEYRNRGIGSALLQALAAEAVEAGATLSLNVAMSNPAQRLYQRLGFRAVSSDGVYAFLVAGGPGRPPRAGDISTHRP